MPAAIEGLARWIEFRLEDVSQSNEMSLQDTWDLKSCSDTINKTKKYLFQEKSKKAVKPKKQSNFEAQKLTMSIDGYNCVKKHYTNTSWTAFLSWKSVNAIKIYGSVFIDSVIEQILR